MASRGERRHHRERVLDRIKKRVRGWFGKESPVYPLRWRDGGRQVVGRKEQYVQRTAVRIAGAGTHTCSACKGERYDRVHDRPELEDDDGSVD